MQVIEADARTVQLPGTFDGALMFAAADVYASEEALENIFPRLRDNARVLAFGAKTSSNRLVGILKPLPSDGLLQALFPNNSESGLRTLAKRVEKLEVEEYFFGWMFLASGSMGTKKGQ